ncbi:MAG TPA: radical SAM protein, partial [Burkholderiales bacterium]|nr:radical SAM protein [Burkholderiales bacterium]
MLKINHDNFYIEFDRELIEKCQTNAPRYTSYPTADRFNFSYNLKEHLSQIKSELINNKSPISLYIHIPFCNTLCLYCACNKIITNDRNKIIKYLKYLEEEVRLYYEQVGKKLEVLQLHFGGGSPSWLSVDEITQVMKFLHKYFNFAKAEEISIEIDPRHTTNEFMQVLKDNGFNRISIGLQDFDEKVQKIVNRVQSYSDSKMILDTAKRLNFHSTNIDLIYG